MTFKPLLSTQSAETVTTQLVDFADDDLTPGDVTVSGTRNTRITYSSISSMS